MRFTTGWLFPTALLLTLAGAALFVLSLDHSWWGMIMYAPQYPEGLEMVAGLRSMTGDIEELDQLNHYIGMMKLDRAAQMERAAAPLLVYGFSALAVLGALVQRRRLTGWLLRAPLLSFPVFFLADMKFWLWYAGNHLDPRAALSSAIRGFTPSMLGQGKIAQFETVGWLEPGFWLAVAGAALVVAGGLLLTRSAPDREV